MRNKQQEATVVDSMAIKLAPQSRSERERLFSRLESFVNLADSWEDFQKFQRKCPGFLPVTLEDVKTLATFPPEFDRSDANFKRLHHREILDYRNHLRWLWQSAHGLNDSRESAPFLEKLLGLRLVLHAPAWLFPFRRGPEQPHPVRERRTLPGTECLPDWKSGVFLLSSDREFARAMILLWRESWRAKRCAREQCSQYFVAAKPATRYCSTECFSEAKRRRNLEWWTQHGREKRTEQRKSKRGGG
jgi:hypothetical protein